MKWRLSIASLILPALLTLMSACSSVGLGDGPLSDYAAVTINSNDQFAISEALIDVFEENGFRTLRGAPPNLYFHKPGSGTTRAVWGNLGNTNTPWIEPKVTLSPHPTKNATRVTCDVSIKQAGNLGVDEKKPFLTGTIGYSSMLNQAKKRVEAGM